METIQRLEKWLNKPGNTHREIAHALDYYSGETVRVWVKNKRIPRREEQAVVEFLNTKEGNVKNGNRNRRK